MTLKKLQGNLERILTLAPMVAAHPGITLGELSRRFDCTQAEIRADLTRILLCGVPPYLPNDFVLVDIEGDRVYLDFAESFARPVSLLVEEALALKLALENLAPVVSGTAAARVVASLTAKVGRLLADRDTAAEEATTRVVLGSGRSEHGQLQVLADCIARERPLELTYYTAARDATSRRIVWPRRFLEKGGVLYLVAHCSLRGCERSFRLDRIRDLDWGDDVARRASEQAEAGPLAEPAPVPVVLRFAPEVARYVEERYAGVERDPSTGWATLTLQARYLEWIFAWLLPFGGQAEIVSPPEARAQFAHRLDRILARNAS